MNSVRPPILYKYYPVEPWLPDLMSGKSIQFSSRTTFNDPFDSRSGLRVDASQTGLKWLIERFKEEQPHWSPAVRLARAQQAHRRCQNAFVTQEVEMSLDNIGILSLTEHWDNMLMWSHYAKHHTGICIGFHTDLDIFRTALSVLYTTSFPIIVRPQDENETILEKSFLMKAKCWEYEKEWRIIKRVMSEYERSDYLAENGYLSQDDLKILTDHRGPGRYSFNPAAIASVTLGSKISVDHAKFVMRACSGAGIDVPIFGIEPPADCYLLKRQQFIG